MFRPAGSEFEVGAPVRVRYTETGQKDGLGAGGREALLPFVCPYRTLPRTRVDRREDDLV